MQQISHRALQGRPPLLELQRTALAKELAAFITSEPGAQRLKN